MSSSSLSFNDYNSWLTIIIIKVKVALQYAKPSSNDINNLGFIQEQLDKTQESHRKMLQNEDRESNLRESFRCIRRMRLVVNSLIYKLALTGHRLSKIGNDYIRFFLVLM